MKPPARTLSLEVVATLLVAIGTAIWIVTSFTFPIRAMVYHWPIFVLAAPITVWMLRSFRDPSRRVYAFCHAAAALLTVGRVFNQWPFSGHGLLGAYWACVPLPLPFRVLGALMVPFSYVTKTVLGEPSFDAVTGGLVGLALGLFARWASRAGAQPSARL